MNKLEKKVPHLFVEMMVFARYMHYYLLFLGYTILMLFFLLQNLNQISSVN